MKEGRGGTSRFSSASSVWDVVDPSSRQDSQIARLQLGDEDERKEEKIKKNERVNLVSKYFVVFRTRANP